MIYFIEAVGPDHIKIGFTDKPIEKRLAHLQTGNSFPLRMLGTISETTCKPWRKKEREDKRLHRCFKKMRIRGEWFKPVPHLLDLIRSGTTQFRNIEYIDKLFEKKLTRDSIEVVSRKVFFKWETLSDEIESRRRAGETNEQIVSTCTLKIVTVQPVTTSGGTGCPRR